MKKFSEIKEGHTSKYDLSNSKRLLERPFNEVLASGEPDFPFCLAWANHDWKIKTWSLEKKDQLLIKQTYNDLEDYTDHFNSVLPAFLDKRYIRIKNKPIFLILEPTKIPDVSVFISHWNQLAIQNGLVGIHFIGYANKIEEVDNFISKGFDSVSLDLLFKSFRNRNIIKRGYSRLVKALFKIPNAMNYEEYANYLLQNIPVTQAIHPSIIPNYDHSPRSGKLGILLKNDSPAKFAALLRALFTKIAAKERETNIVILRSWNEWAEGNYMEPDLKFGRGYLEALKQEMNNAANQ